MKINSRSKLIYNLNINPDENYSETLKPFPLSEIYDYRIHGVINSSGEGSLIYSQQNLRNSVKEKIPFILKDNLKCGEVKIDIRVYDRDSDAIAAMIKRGIEGQQNR